MYAIQPGTKQQYPTQTAKSAILTRDILAVDGASALVREDEPKVRLLSDAERQALLTEFLRTRPTATGDLWVFAYGSLIWNPALRVAEHRIADIRGWHRSFCLSMAVGRGTPDEPGLVLGLDQGGSCRGVAYRIAEPDIGSELPILWNREMLIGGYRPSWVDVSGRDGKTFGEAIAFTIDRGHEHYAGGLAQHEKIRRIATAAGSWGSSADYLFRTIDGLREHGIRDDEVERTGNLVGAAISEDLRAAA